jgi:hypothetical protein
MDPKAMPPLPPDKLNNPQGLPPDDGPQVSVDIQKAPDSPVVENPGPHPASHPGMPGSLDNPAGAAPQPGMPSGPAVPPVAGMSMQDGMPPMPNQNVGGASPQPPMPGAPMQPMPSPMNGVPTAPGMPGAPGVEPAGSMEKPAQPGQPPLFGHDSEMPPVHTTARTNHLMMAVVGLLVILVISIIAAFLMSRS